METLPILSCGTIHDESLNLLSFSQWISNVGRLSRMWTFPLGSTNVQPPMIE